LFLLGFGGSVHAFPTTHLVQWRSGTAVSAEAVSRALLSIFSQGLVEEGPEKSQVTVHHELSEVHV
jgi:hypothetical protein